MNPDPYEVLGVPPTATAEEIKAAYRRLVRLLHPDAAGEGDRAAFHRVQEAYELLGDPGRRRLHDRGRSRPSPAAPPETPPGSAEPAPGDVAMELVMTSAEARAGGTATLRLALDVLCPACGGVGENVFTGICPHCRGVGRVSRQRDVRVDLPQPAFDGMVIPVPLDAYGRPRSRLMLRLRIENG